MNFPRRLSVTSGRSGINVNPPPTIGQVTWATAVGWHRRTDRDLDRAPAQPAADAETVLRTGVLVLDGAAHPVLINPAAFELGLVRDGDPPQPVHPAVRSQAGQVRRSGEGREV